MSPSEQMEIIKALVEGRRIERQGFGLSSESWAEINPDDSGSYQFNFSEYKYRVKHNDVEDVDTPESISKVKNHLRRWLKALGIEYLEGDHGRVRYSIDELNTEHLLYTFIKDSGVRKLLDERGIQVYDF